jgi:hypothetical protein
MNDLAKYESEDRLKNENKRHRRRRSYWNDELSIKLIIGAGRRHSWQNDI